VHEEFRKDAIVPKITGRADAVLNEKHLPGKKWSKRRASARDGIELLTHNMLLTT